mmetsp:Transcript_52816/g.171876  ORF Transcript_52816/g.171876 Transcript_52816/m.171876 type:complete len:221 (+) Transcript_52816:61-723(+)
MSTSVVQVVSQAAPVYVQGGSAAAPIYVQQGGSVSAPITSYAGGSAAAPMMSYAGGSTSAPIYVVQAQSAPSSQYAPTQYMPYGSVEVPIYQSHVSPMQMYQQHAPVTTAVPQQLPTYTSGVGGFTPEQLKVLFPMGAPATFTSHMAPAAAPMMSMAAAPTMSMAAAHIAPEAAHVEAVAAVVESIVEPATTSKSASKKKTSSKDSKKKASSKKSKKGCC